MATLGSTVRRGAAFGGLALVWGLNYLFVRYGLGLSAPLWLAFLRAATGAAGAFAIAAVSGSAFALDARGRAEAILLGLPNTALFFGLWFVAGASVLPGEAATVVYTFPLWVALLSAPVLGERLSPLHWFAVSIGFVGIALVSEPWSATVPLDLVAIAELLAAAFSWALATVVVQRRFRPTEIQTANAYQLLGGAGGLLAASLILEPGQIPVASGPLAATVLWLGLPGTAIGYAVWFHLLMRTRAATLSAYVFLVPIVALAASAVFFGERLDPVQVGGVAFVLVAIYATGRAGGSRPRGTAPAGRPESATGREGDRPSG